MKKISFQFITSNLIFWHTTRHKFFCVLKVYLQKRKQRNKTKPKKQKICLACEGYPSAMQISASQLRDIIQVRFNICLIFHLYIYLIVFKVITGLFFLLPPFILVQIQEHKLALISQLTKLHPCTDFSIGDLKELLQQLSKILGAYSRQQTIGYHHILFNYVHIIYNMHVHISWCYKSSLVNISCQFVCFCFVLFCFFHSRFTQYQASLMPFVGINVSL